MATQLRTDIREPVRATSTERLQRRRGINSDRFFVPPEMIPEGMSWEWKRVSTVGAPDLSHQMMLAENHWTPVTTDQAPGLMPPGSIGNVERDGMRLMQRPAYLTEEARQEVLDQSRQRIQMQNIKNGQGGEAGMPRRALAHTRQTEPLSGRVLQGAIPD